MEKIRHFGQSNGGGKADTRNTKQDTGHTPLPWFAILPPKKAMYPKVRKIVEWDEFAALHLVHLTQCRMQPIDSGHSPFQHGTMRSEARCPLPIWVAPRGSAKGGKRKQRAKWTQELWFAIMWLWLKNMVLEARQWEWIVLWTGSNSFSTSPEPTPSARIGPPNLRPK